MRNTNIWMDLEVKGVAASRSQPRLFSRRKNSLQVCKPRNFPLTERFLQLLPPSFPPVIMTVHTHTYLGSAFPRFESPGPPKLKIIIILKFAIDWSSFNFFKFKIIALSLLFQNPHVFTENIRERRKYKERRKCYFLYNVAPITW